MVLITSALANCSILLGMYSHNVSLFKSSFGMFSGFTSSVTCIMVGYSCGLLFKAMVDDSNSNPHDFEDFEVLSDSEEPVVLSTSSPPSRPPTTPPGRVSGACFAARAWDRVPRNVYGLASLTQPRTRRNKHECGVPCFLHFFF